MANQQQHMPTQQKDKMAGGTCSTMAESAKETAGRAGDMIKDAAYGVAHKTAEAGSYVAHKAEDATSAVGEGIKSLAGTLRDKGPHDGMLGNASSSVAASLESCGKELEHGLSGVAQDLTNTIRRHPVPAIFVGIGLGFLLARVCAK